VAVQEDRDLARDLLLGGGFDDAAPPHRPPHLAQRSGLAFDKQRSENVR
jgi:hypothetical protein